MQPRLATLIGALATGFFQQTREIIFAEQEQVRSALIAKRKRAEEEIRKFKTVADQSNFGMAISDLKGNLQYVNEYFAEIHGYSSQELVGENLEIFHNKEQLERVRKINEGLIETGSYSNEEVWHTRKDDTTFPALMNGVIIKDDEGKPQFLAATAIDITALKRAEAQAVQSNRLAAMGWLAAALAHEINNPLQAIQANLELAMDFGLEPDEHEKHLHVVRQEIERLAEITRRVLDFARPADDTRYPVSITRLIQEALQLVGKQLELAHIQATTDLPADLPSVFVAPNQILQVLLNLSGNAIEAMPDGGHLHITARAGENVVELALTNDGPPLSAEHIERIFDPFFTTKPNGAGLGLSISHSIVSRHGGTINAENLKDQRGVTFTITLPIARPGKEQEVVV